RRCDGRILRELGRRAEQLGEVMASLDADQKPLGVLYSILGQVFITTIRPASFARCAAASSITPSWIQTAETERRSACSMAWSTTAPTREELTKQSTTSTFVPSGMSARLA